MYMRNCLLLFFVYFRLWDVVLGLLTAFMFKVV